jgi:hypothetical protein
MVFVISKAASAQLTDAAKGVTDFAPADQSRIIYVEQMKILIMHAAKNSTEQKIPDVLL